MAVGAGCGADRHGKLPLEGPGPCVPPLLMQHILAALPAHPTSCLDPPCLTLIPWDPALLLVHICMMMVPNTQATPLDLSCLWSMVASGFEPYFRKLGAIHGFSAGSFGCFLQLHLQKQEGIAPFLNPFWSWWLQHCTLQTGTSLPHSEETRRDLDFHHAGREWLNPMGQGCTLSESPNTLETNLLLPPGGLLSLSLADGDPFHQSFAVCLCPLASRLLPFQMTPFKDKNNSATVQG